MTYPTPTATVDLPLLRFASFPADDGLAHAVTTRHGGVSQPPWATLNLGGSVHDDPAAVDENTERMCAALGVPRASLVTAYMVAGNRVAVATAEHGGQPFRETDALVTATPGVFLTLRYADCVPVLLVDPLRRAVGIAHAGWRGTLALVAQRTALTMMSEFDCRAEDIRAAVGPSIGPCCYEVGDEVVAQTQAVFAGQADDLLTRRASRVHLDLWQANRLQLKAVGVGQVEVAGICTRCHTDDYFSHRGEGGRTGRFGAVIGYRG
ncbi:MAG: peptidoglycan editing factor PgeF [Anaerolineae bacterium]|nr:peptidoglycan editing factor PgeF [Anaerolineae bacterium]